MDVIKQASAIPYKFLNGKYHILLVTSRKKRKWILPKGIVEPGDSSKETAYKEALEEAGVTGKIILKKIGSYRVTKLYAHVRIKVFALKVNKILDIWDEMHFRKRKWFTLNEAIEIIESEELRKLLIKFSKQIHT